MDTKVMKKIECLYTKKIVLIVIYHKILNWSDFVEQLIQIIKLLVFMLKITHSTVAQISCIEYLREHVKYKK